MMKPMKDYIPLLTVRSENITIPKLTNDQLDTRALDKLDSKIFFKKKKLNELAKKIDNSVEIPGSLGMVYILYPFTEIIEPSTLI